MMKRVSASLVVALLCSVASGLWSSDSRAQRSRTEFQRETQRNRPEPPPAPVAPVTPVMVPATNPSSPLGSALAACETGSEVSELSLPGAKGEIKLDRCYRGRDHLVCQFNALRAEAKLLLENYRKIVDASYPEVRDIAGICTVKSDVLAGDLQNATEFAGRFKALKAEYESRANCATRIEQSLTQVNLPEMTQAQGLIKSMTDAIQADVKGVSEMQGRLSDLAEKMNAAQKAMITLEKIHRSMCLAHQDKATDNTNSKDRISH